MFFKYFRPILAPFEKLRMMFVSKKMEVGRVKTDASRVKSYKGRMKNYADDAKSKAGKVKGGAGKIKGKAGEMKGKAGKARQKVPGRGKKGKGRGAAGGRGAGPPPAAGRSGGPIQPQRSGGGPPPPAPAPGGGAPGAGGQPAVGNGNANANATGITEKGFLFWKKRICNGCGAKLDKTWDACPYCAQNNPQAAAPAPQKTQAFMIDPAGGGGTVQLLGWIIPIAGPQRGELFTLSPVSKIGTDPSCTVCLADSFMSSEHAEIFAEDGVWIVKDLGSTNGTYVNDKRVEKQELVDNDMVKFGQSQVKFKSL